MRCWWVYILTNYSNRVLYVGMTENLARRVNEHKKGKPGSFSKQYRLYKLVWYRKFGTINEARDEEVRIKGLLRESKLELIKQLNASFQDLGHRFTLR